MTRSSEVLDLSELAGSGRKVKLRDQQLYDIANPSELGVIPQQRIISRYGRAEVLMRKVNPTNKQLDEMMTLLIDVAAVVVPDAPRDELGRLGLDQLDRLIKDFLSASPDQTTAAEADSEAATGDRSTSASS